MQLSDTFVKIQSSTTAVPGMAIDTGLILGGGGVKEGLIDAINMRNNAA